MANCKYVILKASEVSSIDFSKVLEEGTDDLVYSLDGSNTYVRFIGDTPSFLDGKWSLTGLRATLLFSNSEWDEYSVEEPQLEKDDV